MSLVLYRLSDHFLLVEYSPKTSSRLSVSGYLFGSISKRLVYRRLSSALGPAYFLAPRCSFRLRRIEVELRMRDAHHPPVEPTHDVFQTFDAVPGLAGAREFVCLAWKDGHGGWPFHVLERTEQLFPARVLRG